MAIDSALGRLGIKQGVCTSSTRPTNPFEGQVIYESDTNRTLVYDNAAWVVVADNQVLSIDAANSRVVIGGALISRIPISVWAGSGTLALTDESKWISMQPGSAATVTIPPDASVAFPTGAQILIGRQTAQTVTIAQGSGVSLFSTLGSGDRVVGNVDGFVTLLKYATNHWYIFGDIA